MAGQALPCAQRLVQQIVGRERRERLSQLALCSEGCFDSRRRVNSTVMHYPVFKKIARRLLVSLAGPLLIPFVIYGLAEILDWLNLSTLRSITLLMLPLLWPLALGDYVFP